MEHGHSLVIPPHFDGNNYAYNLGEIYDQPKIVRKILRSLIENFRPKVTVITESKDVDSILVD